MDKIRSRQDIEQDVKNRLKDVNLLIIEVLLDIREMLYEANHNVNK